MTTVSGAFSHIIAPGLRKVFFNKFNELEPEYVKVANILNSKRAYEDELVVAGLGETPEKPEGEATDYSDPIEGDTVRYTQVPYGLGFRVTHEMMEYDLHSVMKRMSAELGDSGRTKIETNFWGIFNDAFAGATYTGFDGAALISTAHTILRTGETVANRPATDIDLSISGLQASIIRMETMKTETGRKMRLTPALTVIHPNNLFLAQEIYGTTAGKPYTSDNTQNVLAGYADIFVSHYLTDSDAWYNLATKAKHDIKIFFGEWLKFFSGDDFDTGDAKFRSYFRMSEGFSDWRGVDGSSGG